MPFARSSIVLAAMLGLATVATAQTPAADGAYHVTQTFKVGGEGRWDYISVDPASKLLYVSRQSHTQIVHEQSGEVAADLTETPGVHGVAIAPELSRAFTSNGKGNSISIVDLKTMKIIGTTPAGQNPDAILFDPFSKKVFCFNGKSNDATVIDATAAPGAAALATIPLGDKPEFSASDNAGHIYVNLEGKSSVVEIDAQSLKITHTWKIEGGEEPSGLAIDIAHHRLFCGCGGNNVMAVVDTQSGKTLATIPIGKGVDACAYDPSTNEAFASCGDGTLTVAKENGSGKFETQSIPTKPGARTMVLDPMTHTIYLPAAEMEPAADGKRPTPKPGSFMIVVVSKDNAKK
jgi:DNA-binding beta-propeller fold protein YncE